MKAKITSPLSQSQAQVFLKILPGGRPAHLPSTGVISVVLWDDKTFTAGVFAADSPISNSSLLRPQHNNKIKKPVLGMNIKQMIVFISSEKDKQWGPWEPWNEKLLKLIEIWLKRLLCVITSSHWVLSLGSSVGAIKPVIMLLVSSRV